MCFECISKIHILKRKHKSKSSEVFFQTYSYFVKLAKLQSSVSVNRRSDVLAVVTVLNRLELPHTANVGQASLNLCHVQHLLKWTSGSLKNTLKIYSWLFIGLIYFLDILERFVVSHLLINSSPSLSQQEGWSVSIAATSLRASRHN